MTKKYLLLFSTALCLTVGTAYGILPDHRQADRAPEAVRFELSDNPSENLRPRKPHLKGDFRVAGKKHGKAKTRATASASPLIYANIVDYAPNDEPGIYSFTPDTYEFTPVATDGEFGYTYGSTYSNGTFIGIDGKGFGYTWNADNWSLIAGPVASTNVKSTTMAADPTDGTIYSCAFAADGQSIELITIDPSTFTRVSTLSKVDETISALVFDQKGTLYGFGDTGKLFTIDKTNGSFTYKGDTGIDAYFDGAAVIDPASGVCFYAATDWECGLYEVNLSTCEAKLIMEFDDEEEIKSMYILPEAPATGAPAAAENLKTSFEKGSMTGKISFTAPTLTFDGATGTGNLNYILACNDVELKRSSCEWGEDVTVDYTAPETGSYAFVVTMYSDAGESRQAAKGCWIGNDTPGDPSNLKVVRKNGENLITWNAPSSSLHGGYVAFDEITYTVTRFPGNSIVAEGIKECQYTDKLADGNAPEQYHYTVTASWNGAESGSVTSNNVMVGAVYYNSFDTQEQFDEFLSVSLILDGPEWTYASWYKAATVSDFEDAAVSAWLISPAFQLSAGNTYTLKFDTWCSNDNYKENLSVYITPTSIPADIYTATPVINKMTINWEYYDTKTITAEFTPEADGTYYLTFNGCSARDLGSVYVDNILLYRNSTVPFPASPEVSGEVMFGNMAMISVTAPATDTDGNELESLLRLDIFRNGEMIKSYDNPEPGETYNFIDMIPGEGSFTYTAIAYSEAGPSAAGSYLISTVAAAKPRQARITSITENGNSGEITLEWDAPTTDLSNNPIVDGTLTYSIYVDGQDQPVATGLTDTKHTWQAVESGKQEFLSFFIVVSNEAGDSAPSAMSEPRPFGTPDKAPYAESFAGMEPTNVWNFYNSDDYSEGRWLFVAGSETPKASPVDNDGGMLAFEGEYLDDTAWATSGKIDLGEGTSPRLSFWYFAVNATEGKDQLDVMVSDGSGYKRLDSFTMRDAMANGWMKRTVDLSAYAGKVISLRLVGTSFRTRSLMLIDRIEILTLDKDVEAAAFIAPASVITGKEFSITGVVLNNGNDINGTVTVSLLRDGVEVAKDNIYGIQSGAEGYAAFTQEADAGSAETIKYQMTVTLDGDQVTDNNTSEEVTVKVIPCTLPTVQNLQASYTSDKKSDVRLTWTAPDVTALAPEAYTENFEYYEPFEINPEGDWHFIDGDGDYTYGSQSYPFEGMTDPKAFIVLDSDHFNLTYTAHSGNRYLASFSGVNKQNDDWMISPELFGGAQTVSLHARSYTDMYGSEQFEILASSSGNAVADFKLVKKFETVPTEWTEFSADLPEGTKYFAIRCTSSNTFMFFVDDVTYIPAVHPATKFNITGFNLFVNGKRVNNSPIFSMAYNHMPAAGTDPEYALSVIYDHGESILSKSVKPSLSNVEIVAEETLTAHAIAGGIEINGKGNATVVSADGRMLFSGNVDGTVFVPTASGVYLAGATNAPVKVIVR